MARIRKKGLKPLSLEKNSLKKNPSSLKKKSLKKKTSISLKKNLKENLSLSLKKKNLKENPSLSLKKKSLKENPSLSLKKKSLEENSSLSLKKKSLKKKTALSLKKKSLKENPSLSLKKKSLKENSLSLKKKGLKKKPLSLKKKSFTKKSLIKKRKVLETRRGVVFFSNLPNGFYEQALDKYLQQFGDVRRIKVGKSLKNAKPMGYAYVEFEHEKVALIVAKAMNNYLMFKKLLKCKFIKHDNLNEKMWAHGDLTPELCPGTMKKRRNQYVMESGSAEFALKKEGKARRVQNFLENTLGLKLEGDYGNKSLKKIRMEIDESDNEISIKTPPNVVKVTNKMSSNSVRPIICDGDATTVKKSFNKRRSSSIKSVTKELFSTNAKNEDNSKRLKLGLNKKKILKINSDKAEKKGESVMGKERRKMKTTVKLAKSIDSSKPTTKSFSDPKPKKIIKKRDIIVAKNKKKQTSLINKSSKKVLSDLVKGSSYDKTFTSKKRQSEDSPKSSAIVVQTNLTPNPVNNKIISNGIKVNKQLPKSSKNIRITPNSKATKKNIENLVNNKSPKSTKKVGKDVKENSTPNLKSKKVSPALKRNKCVLNASTKLEEKAEQNQNGKLNQLWLTTSSLNKLNIEISTSINTLQSKKNRRASLGVNAILKKANTPSLKAKTPTANRLRSKQKVHLPLSV